MTEASQLLLQHFKEKKAEKDSTSLQEARRLVNLYRSLPFLGEDFISRYNQMLLQVKPGVKRLLGTFMGGKEVEDYLEFLEENAHLSKTESEQQDTVNVSQTKGYLPTPDNDLEIKKVNGMITISEAEWQEMKIQKEALVQQIKTLLHTFESLGQTAPPKAPEKKTAFENYSEIIEDVSGGKSNE
ncbi:MAG: hypothetical protein ACI4OR_04340 [Alphaproteobacteria bacterium]